MSELRPSLSWIDALLRINELTDERDKYRAALRECVEALNDAIATCDSRKHFFVTRWNKAADKARALLEGKRKWCGHDDPSWCSDDCPKREKK